MNARLYDPLLHRFLAPDNYVQNPYSTQNFNRYGYVLNNPLKYNDPSGEFPIVAALIGALINVAVNGISNTMAGRPFFQNWGMAAFTGFIGGAASNMIGSAVLSMKFSGAAGKFIYQTLAHAHLGAFLTGISGGNPLHGAIAGALGSIVAAGTGGLLEGVKNDYITAGVMSVSGGIAGGLGSALSGGSFWDGFRNGFISAGLNHALHQYIKNYPKRLKAKIEEDGIITFKEAKKWWKWGNGEDLLANFSKLDFHDINIADFPNGIGSSEYINLFFKNSRSGNVYGTLKLTLINYNMVKSATGYDVFDFNMDGRFFRDIFTRIGRLFVGSGTPYTIRFYGPRIHRRCKPLLCTYKYPLSTTYLH